MRITTRYIRMGFIMRRSGQGERVGERERKRERERRLGRVGTLSAARELPIAERG